jgi:hypothetical protein
MAFIGLHVACGVAASDRTDTLTRQPLFGGVVWSQTLIAQDVCDEVMRGDKPVVRLKASADGDWWVAIGNPAPNPAQNPRIMIEAGATEDIACKPGDFIAGMPA